MAISTSQYPGVGGGHWIQSNIDDGSIVILEDDSVWKISSTDTIDTQLWLQTESIVVLENDDGFLPYALVNTDASEKVEAEYVGQK